MLLVCSLATVSLSLSSPSSLLSEGSKHCSNVSLCIPSLRLLAMLLLISPTSFHLLSPFPFTPKVSLSSNHCYSSHVAHRCSEAHACMASDCTTLVLSYTYVFPNPTPQDIHSRTSSTLNCIHNMEKYKTKPLPEAASWFWVTR